MGLHTPIEWCDHSWPIVNGCRRASPGCENCYSERLTATRLAHTPKYKGLAVFDKGPRYTGETRLWEPHLTLPFKWKTPAKIFVADMGDLFYEQVSDQDINRVFAVMSLAPQHVFQVLTKRASRMRAYFADESRWAKIEVAARRLYREHTKQQIAGKILIGPLPHIWLGVSAENQEWANKRIPDLLATPAAIRFVSYEPALGPVDFSKWLGTTPGINWLICGGESGPGARPFNVEWARSVIKQCTAAHVACFIKQLGSDPYGIKLRNRKGGDMSEWPEDLRLRKFPV
jgi:protein gp37